MSSFCRWVDYKIPEHCLTHECWRLPFRHPQRHFTSQEGGFITWCNRETNLVVNVGIKIRGCSKICSRVWLYVRWLEGEVWGAGICYGGHYQGIGVILHWKSILCILDTGGTEWGKVVIGKKAFAIHDRWVVGMWFLFFCRISYNYTLILCFLIITIAEWPWLMCSMTCSWSTGETPESNCVSQCPLTAIKASSLFLIKTPRMRRMGVVASSLGINLLTSGTEALLLMHARPRKSLIWEEQ